MLVRSVRLPRGDNPKEVRSRCRTRRTSPVRATWASSGPRKRKRKRKARPASRPATLSCFLAAAREAVVEQHAEDEPDRVARDQRGHQERRGHPQSEDRGLLRRLLGGELLLDHPIGDAPDLYRGACYEKDTSGDAGADGEPHKDRALYRHTRIVRWAYASPPNGGCIGPAWGALLGQMPRSP